METITQPELQQIHTSCHDCVFAATDHNLESGEKLQWGCHANRLNKFDENGIEIVSAYNGSHAFFIVNGASCFYKRTWPKPLNGDYEDCLKLVIEQSIPKIQIILMVETYDTIDEIKKCVDSILNWQEKSVQINLVLFDNFSDENERMGLNPAEVARAFDNLELPIFIDEPRLNKWFDVIDLIVEKSQANFYAVAKINEPIANAVPEIIHHTVELMKPFMILKKEHGRERNYYTTYISSRFHKNFGGNRQIEITETQKEGSIEMGGQPQKIKLSLIEDKAQYISENLEQPKLIIKVHHEETRSH